MPFKGKGHKIGNYRRSAKKYAGKAFKFAANYNPYIQAAHAMFSMLSSSGSKEGPSSAITTQKDSKTLYRRRRAPKRVRRKAARRAKNFISRLLKSKSDNTNLFNNELSDTSNADEQHMSSMTFGYLGTKAAITDDIGDWHECFQNYLNADPILTSKAWYITGLSYDITISNNVGGATTDGTALELDIYEYVFRKDYNMDQATVADELKESLAKETKLPGATLAMDFLKPGSVPTDANQFMRYIIIKSKQRYYIPLGDSISFVKRIRFTRPIKITSEMLDAAGSVTTGFAKGGLTRGLLLISKGTASVDKTKCIGASSWCANIQSRYRFKVIDTNANKNAFGT